MKTYVFRWLSRKLEGTSLEPIVNETIKQYGIGTLKHTQRAAYIAIIYAKSVK